MTEEAMRIAIAEACGWTMIATTVNGRADCLMGVAPLQQEMDSQQWLALPDYLNDLNAMAEARKTLTPDERSAFVAILHARLKTSDRVLTNENWFNAIDASAAVQAEAFLRAKGLFIESP